LLYSPIAGGVIIGSSSILIYNPMAAILLGIIAGSSQCLFNLIDKKMVARPIFSNNGFFLFAIQGLFGGLAAAVMRAISLTSTVANYSSLVSPYEVFSTESQIGATFISVAIGTGSGLLIGVILMNYTYENTVNDCYNDNAYWLI
jgi:hypothetical protein